jgi:ABC-type uncharacterized transport system ATPase subunit
MQEAIIVSQLSKSYDNHKVVDDLNFAVEKGKVLGNQQNK